MDEVLFFRFVELLVYKGWLLRPAYSLTNTLQLLVDFE